MIKGKHAIYVVTKYSNYGHLFNLNHGHVRYRKKWHKTIIHVHCNNKRGI